MATTFSDKKIEAKIGILEFLKEEQLNKVVFKFKETTANHLNKRNIDYDSIFPSGKPEIIGQIKNISPDHVISLLGASQEVSIPLEFLENVSLSK